MLHSRSYVFLGASLPIMPINLTTDMAAATNKEAAFKISSNILILPNEPLLPSYTLIHSRPMLMFLCLTLQHFLFDTMVHPYPVYLYIENIYFSQCIIRYKKDTRCRCPHKKVLVILSRWPALPWNHAMTIFPGAVFWFNSSDPG